MRYAPLLILGWFSWAQAHAAENHIHNYVLLPPYDLRKTIQIDIANSEFISTQGDVIRIEELTGCGNNAYYCLSLGHGGVIFSFAKDAKHMAEGMRWEIEGNVFRVDAVLKENNFLGGYVITQEFGGDIMSSYLMDQSRRILFFQIHSKYMIYCDRRAFKAMGMDKELIEHVCTRKDGRKKYFTKTYVPLGLPLVLE